MLWTLVITASSIACLVTTVGLSLIGLKTTFQSFMQLMHPIYIHTRWHLGYSPDFHVLML